MKCVELKHWASKCWERLKTRLNKLGNQTHTVNSMSRHIPSRQVYSSACFSGRHFFFVNIACANYSAGLLTGSDLLSMRGQKMAQLCSVSLLNNLKHGYSTGTMESLNWRGNYDMYAQVAHLIITAKYSSTASVRVVHFENTSNEN